MYGPAAAKGGYHARAHTSKPRGDSYSDHQIKPSLIAMCAVMVSEDGSLRVVSTYGDVRPVGPSVRKRGWSSPPKPGLSSSRTRHCTYA
jgi:hypothetical protein